jgi:ferric-dicitrate binding protein FerR (iron transport regulator)
MRQIYTSPRPGNIDRVVALMAEHGIATQVENRSGWRTQGHRRFSYQEPDDAREHWEQVWVTHADDFTRARELMRELGIEPVIRFGQDLAATRNPSPQARRKYTVARARRIVMLAILAACALMVLHYRGVI